MKKSSVAARLPALRASLAAMVLTWVASVFTSSSQGCLVTSDPCFSDSEFNIAEGACMCALCWTQQFCFDPARPENEGIYDPPCDDPAHEAVPASRVTGAAVAREDGFFCIQPDQKNVLGPNSGASLECPASADARSEFENLDPCVDVPACARPEGECGDPPEQPLCPDTSPSPLRVVCTQNTDFEACGEDNDPNLDEGDADKRLARRLPSTRSSMNVRCTVRRRQQPGRVGIASCPA